jgi:kinetochore protein NDC80
VWLQLESVLNTLEERLRQYHACCHRLALLPATAKRAAGIGYDMGVNRSASTPQELISGDIKVRPHTSMT